MHSVSEKNLPPKAFWQYFHQRRFKIKFYTPIVCSPILCVHGGLYLITSNFDKVILSTTSSEYLHFTDKKWKIVISATVWPISRTETVSEVYGCKKIYFRNPRWWTAATLKIENSDISWWCRTCNFLMVGALIPSVLWRCWLGGRKGIRPVKNWVVGCWHGYLSGARCRLAYGPADATATHCLLLQ